MSKPSHPLTSKITTTESEAVNPKQQFSRRDLLKTALQAGAVTASGALISGCLQTSSNAGGTTDSDANTTATNTQDTSQDDGGNQMEPLGAPFRIDVHCHHIPDFYRLSLLQAGYTTAGGIPIPQWTPELALGFMNRYGVEVQVLSISEPGVTHLSDRFERLVLARRINDYTHQLMNGYDPVTGLSHPLYAGRFGGFACLPLGDPTDSQDIDNAIGEVSRSLSQLGMDGIGLLTHYNGVYLGDAAFDPLLQALDAQGAKVFLHPVTPAAYPELNLPTFLYEFTFDTTRAVVNMLYRQVFERFPNINWILSHAGGAIPYLAYRTGLLTATPAVSQAIQSGSTFTHLTKDLVAEFLPPKTNYPKAYRNLIYDTALSPTAASMLSAKEVAGTSNIQFGSDWPFSELILSTAGDPAPQLSDTFSAHERNRVERSNALALFPRIRTMLGE